LFDAKSKVVQLPHLEFSGCVSLGGGLSKPIDGLGRIVRSKIQNRANGELCHDVTCVRQPMSCGQSALHIQIGLRSKGGRTGQNRERGVDREQ